MSMKRWTQSNKAVFNVGYHLIWCPKYRRPVLVGKIKERLIEVLEEKANENKTIIKYMSIMPDHVHLFVKAQPVDSPHWIIKEFKGYSSRVLRGEFPSLRSRLPSLWTRSYYCESVGHISEKTIKRYIEEQKNQ